MGWYAKQLPTECFLSMLLETIIAFDSKNRKMIQPVTAFSC